MTQPFNLEAAVGRPLGCVPRGGWQGTTRRNSRSIATSCNAAKRRAGRAPGVVATFTQWVSGEHTRTASDVNGLQEPTSGQLPLLGSMPQGQSESSHTSNLGSLVRALPSARSAPPPDAQAIVARAPVLPKARETEQRDGTGKSVSASVKRLLQARVSGREVIRRAPFPTRWVRKLGTLDPAT